MVNLAAAASFIFNAFILEIFFFVFIEFVPNSIQNKVPKYEYVSTDLMFKIFLSLMNV